MPRRRRGFAPTPAAARRRSSSTPTRSPITSPPRDPAAITGMCEDYRAAATLDLAHDRASRAAGQRVRCPMLALWGGKGLVNGWYDPLALWREYCDAEVSGGPVDAGHYVAEEAPDAVLAALDGFLKP